MLVNGKWSKGWTPVQKADGEGRFVRQVSSFRNWITLDGSEGPTGTGGFKREISSGRAIAELALATTPLCFTARAVPPAVSAPSRQLREAISARASSI